MAQVVTGGEGERFELLEELGRGAMGTVWRARQLPFQREVALKLLIKVDARQTARLLREGELMARLDHPGVVAVHGAGWIEDRPYLACELVRGARSLEEVYLDAPLAERVEWLIQAGHALGAAHALGIVHRDVKLENLLLDPAGRVRVTDFGIATAVGLEQLTQTGAQVGTPYTMSPEQVRGDRDQLGPPSDVWALGVLLYLALTEDYPFDGVSQLELISQILAAAPPPPRSLVPDAPPALEALCLRALAAEPAERPASGALFARALAAARAPRVARGSRGPLLVVGAVALAATGGVAALLLRGAGTTPTPSSPSPVASVSSETAPSSPLARARAAEAAGAADVAQRYEEAAAAGELEALRWLADHAPDPATAARWLERAAARGDLDCTVRFGRALELGEGLSNDQARARLLYRRAAEAGHARGMYHLGWCFENGVGGERDLREASRWYADALAKHDPAAQMWIGLKRYRAGELAVGLEMLQASAAQDFAPAIVQLARICRQERPTDALRYLERAAALGDTTSATARGMLLLELKRTEEGLEVLEASGKQGDEQALTKLGEYYLDAFDLQRAEDYLRRGIASAQAKRLLGRILAGRGQRREALALAEEALNQGDGGARVLVASLVVESDAPRAQRLLQEAATDGDPEAMVALAEAASRQDPQRALALLERAARLGSREGMYRLACMLREARPQDALGWLRRAAEKGHPQACADVGLALIYGRGGFERDPAAALPFLERAAPRNLRAQVALGRLWVQGGTGRQDPALAEGWLRRAAESGDLEGQYELGRFTIWRGDQAVGLALIERAAAGGFPLATRALERRAFYAQRGVSLAYTHVMIEAAGAGVFLPYDWDLGLQEQDLLLFAPEPAPNERHMLRLHPGVAPGWQRDPTFLGPIDAAVRQGLPGASARREAALDLGDGREARSWVWSHGEEDYRLDLVTLAPGLGLANLHCGPRALIARRDPVLREILRAAYGAPRH
ncbi:MAG: serine/threonine-protein kinase [Planctomycetota bacterium]